MWQSQPLRFNQYSQNSPNNYYDVAPATTTLNPNPNASIDFVVTQVDQLANQINTLVADSESAGLQIADRGVETYNRMSNAFNNGTIQNINRIGDIASEKFGDWPVTELIIMVIVGVVLVVITVGGLVLTLKNKVFQLIFLFVLFGERVYVYRNRKKLTTDSEII
uniref:t-SNARE coiled-coil homology domain-containing protein n=1 Tax=Caenorhabditis tropicalis TaxID=1561998 RepID=A0A1I7T6V8_9PELO